VSSQVVPHEAHPTGPARAGADGAPSAAEIAERVAQVPFWYHTFEFAPGVVTNGFFDHRQSVRRLPFPPSLAGKRCLDLASADGFFAFEMARRGGDVVSVDLEDATQQDWQGVSGPPPDGGTTGANARFEIAQWATGLPVERVQMNVYDASVESLGAFDFVFMGNILLHLSDPARALRAARSVTAGQFLSFETISLPQTLLRPRLPTAQLSTDDEPRWWTVNTAAHGRLLETAGFHSDRSGFPVMQPFGTGFKERHPPFKWTRGLPLGTQLAFMLVNRPFGVACRWALCH